MSSGLVQEQSVHIAVPHRCLCSSGCLGQPE